MTNEKTARFFDTMLCFVLLGSHVDHVTAQMVWQDARGENVCARGSSLLTQNGSDYGIDDFDLKSGGVRSRY